jgi:benzoyl-CoA-dihydrodiol lyase
MATNASRQPPVSFQTRPEDYVHLKLEVDGAIARILLDIQEDRGLRPGYVLKLNSYDLSVDIELADAVQRLRFEHPEVTCVVVTSALDGVFSSGANIFMLGSSTHAFKVNFCKYTNETRLYIEDATEFSGQVYIAALNGLASGGGYELPLACAEMYLVDDRRSAVALPEVPFLGVLPGTGGLTRVVDKRMVRRDRADVFSTLAEGIKGKRAVQWNLVDGVFPPSQFDAAIAARSREIADGGRPELAGKGVRLTPLTINESDDGTVTYDHITLSFGPEARLARIAIRVPAQLPEVPDEPHLLGADWFPLAMFRELDEALLRLRFNHSQVGCIVITTHGDPKVIQGLDADLAQHADNHFVREVLLHMKRVLKRLDMTAKSIFALAEEGSCFVGSLFELTLAADRCYMLEEEGVSIGLTALNFGALPMGNGITRLQTRFLGDPNHAESMLGHTGELLDSEAAMNEGLVTDAFDDIDWEDEIRLALEERVSLSPDALTGMEANLRFAGPESLETKIFGRLTAWQNWIFQRPNAVGPKGALTLYGRPETAEFDYTRT